MPLPNGPTVGVGMLLEETWVARKTDTSAIGIGLMFHSLGAEWEKVWRVKALAPGYGAEVCRAVRIGDVVLRINGTYITGMLRECTLARCGKSFWY